MDPLSWLYTRDAVGPGSASFVPPPVRVAPLALSAPVAVEAPPQVEELPPPAPLPEPEPIDPVIEAARSTPQVKRGLATRRAIFARLARTRELLILWGKLEKFVADPARRLSRTETAELRKQVEAFVEVLGDFPLFGEAGHPGYLIVALTDLDGVKTIQNLNTNQRESLRRDWVSGRKFLEAHRSYLRGEIRAMRSRGRLSHWIRACRAILNERPLYAALVLLGLVAVGVAVWKNAL